MIKVLYTHMCHKLPYGRQNLHLLPPGGDRIFRRLDSLEESSPVKSGCTTSGGQGLGTNAADTGSSEPLPRATAPLQGSLAGKLRARGPAKHGKVMADPTLEQGLPAPPTRGK